MSLDVLRNTYFSYVHSTISYRIIFLGNSSHHEDIFKTQKRIIMNSSKNASSQQLFKELNILPIQSQYIFSKLLLLNMKTNFCLAHKYIKAMQGKFTICTYLQKTWQYTKRLFITQELRSTIIYLQPLKIYLMIRTNSN